MNRLVSLPIALPFRNKLLGRLNLNLNLATVLEDRLLTCRCTKKERLEATSRSVYIVGHGS
jgi:hypothetical protein